jgi:uncharacterized protein YjbI with pentapeptide repeats
MGERDRKDEWWRQKRWWIPAVVLAVVIAVDLMAAFALPERVIPSVSVKFSEADRLKSIADLRGNILGVLTPAVALIAGIAALLNFQETRRQNERTYETTQRQLDEARRQNQQTFQLARDQFAESQARSREQVELQRRGQVTERFSKAIEQLGQGGDGKLDVRTGGIYALEQIARDSPELHSPIVEILTAFIREHRPWQQELKDSATDNDKFPTDIQTALTVIGRRESKQAQGVLDLSSTNLERAKLMEAKLQGANLAQANLQGANLRGANLRGAKLREANLQEADFKGADLQDATLIGANLQRAYLRGAKLQGADLGGGDIQRAILAEANLRGAKFFNSNLQGANLGGGDLEETFLRDAHLQGANLRGANLQKADLKKAKLQGADLGKAKLQGARLGEADLKGVDLSETAGLTQEQLDSANCDEKTQLPPGLTVNGRPLIEQDVNEGEPDQGK